MSALAKWLDLGPWVDLRGLPQICVSRSGKPLSVVGPELEARLRSDLIPSRIRPDYVEYQQPSTVTPPNFGAVVHGAAKVSTSFPGMHPPVLVPGRTYEPSVLGNGGWDKVDWSTGAINQSPIEVHWPSVLTLIAELHSPTAAALPKPVSGRAPAKREAVANAMLTALRSGELSLEGLALMQKKALSTRFGAGETTCYEVRKIVLNKTTSSDQ